MENKKDEALLVHTAHRLEAAEALLSDQRLEGRVEPVDREYLAACRLRDDLQLQEREDQLRRIAEQSSLILTVAAEAAFDQKWFDQSLRLGVLAARASWLRPAYAGALPVLSRAADASTLRAQFIDHTDIVVSASFSPDGRRVVTASWDKTARVWDADTGKPVGEPMAHGNSVNSARFNPDGRRVVTASDDKTARVWDAGTGKPVGDPMAHGNAVNSARFSPDGRRVVTASDDRTARVWNVFWSSLVRPEDLIEEVCERKLRGNVRKLTEEDVRAARILSHGRVGEDVCDGVATVPTR